MDNPQQKLTAAVCSYNRSDRLTPLIRELRKQDCPIPFEILIVNNNSQDDTLEVLELLQKEEGPPLRFVTEKEQGIPFARNRAVEECMDSDFMFFMDDDELPKPGLLAAAYDALSNEQALCAGGRVENTFEPGGRPSWLIHELLGFLAEIDHGDSSFWITSADTPIWTANVAYNMALFRDDSSLRFDTRYNRTASGIGGGSDAVMFRELLGRKIKMRYRPDMAITHQVETWRLKPTYFLKLHYIAGRKKGEFQLPRYEREIIGTPPFLIKAFIKQTAKSMFYYLGRKRTRLREGMNAAHALGMIIGYRKKIT